MRTGTGNARSLEDRLRDLERATAFREVVLIGTAVNGDDAGGGAVGGGADHTHVDREVLAGTGTSFTLGGTPVAGSEQLFLDGKLQLRVGSSPGEGEYTISGAAITTGTSVTGASTLWAYYRTAVASSHTHAGPEVPSSLGANQWQLGTTPTSGSEQVFVDGQLQLRVTAGPGQGEYTISGAVVTLGWDIGTGSIWAYYRT